MVAEATTPTDATLDVANTHDRLVVSRRTSFHIGRRRIVTPRAAREL